MNVFLKQGSSSAYVNDLSIPTMDDVTLVCDVLLCDVYVKDTGRRAMKRIFDCHRFFSNSRAWSDNVMVQTGPPQVEHYM